MSQFLLLAALLTLLAVAFAISALWQRSRRLAVALALGLPLAAFGLYRLEGEPAALDPKMLAVPASIEDAVTQLEARLASDPDNFEGLVLLARSYMALEKFEPARATYARAMALKPGEFDVAVEYAEAMLRTSADRRFPPEAVRLLEQAVATNPQNQRALYFLGLHQLREGQPAQAAATWEKLLPLLDAETAAAIRAQLDGARAEAGMAPLPADEAAAAPAAASAGALDIEIRIDPTLAMMAQPGDVLYVFARPVEGGGPPLAAKRIELGKLPVHLQLSDEDSPMPAARLSSREQVQLMARLSKSGDVAAASGDLEADPVQVSTRPGERIILVLNRTRP